MPQAHVIGKRNFVRRIVEGQLEWEEMTSRTEYLLWAFKRTLRVGRIANACPACEATDNFIVRRKYVVTALRECRNCSLRYRTPKDDPGAAEAFYVDEVYKQGFTTDLPSNVELRAMMSTRFAGTEKDFGYRIKALEAAGLSPNSRILDFGCSWGYGSWQMRQAGFEVLSYEIGRERAHFADAMLNCVMVSDLRTLDGTVDCFFSSHVIEHLPNPRLMFDEAEKALRPGGLLVCYCPNGAIERENKDFGAYHKNWGKVHPLMLTPQFLKGEARRRGFAQCAVFGSPVSNNDIAAFRDGKLDGDELLTIARKSSEN
jgi:2-polyprenyl-3-methyl-5-hydroxy-6-metoxy-1,4-benzoquinol methylase